MLWLIVAYERDGQFFCCILLFFIACCVAFPFSTPIKSFLQQESGSESEAEESGSEDSGSEKVGF